VDVEHPLAFVDAADRAFVDAGLALTSMHGSMITYVVGGSTLAGPRELIHSV
jgi:hypothetical protein